MIFCTVEDVSVAIVSKVILLKLDVQRILKTSKLLLLEVWPLVCTFLAKISNLAEKSGHFRRQVIFPKPIDFVLLI